MNETNRDSSPMEDEIMGIAYAAAFWRWRRRNLEALRPVLHQRAAFLATAIQGKPRADIRAALQSDFEQLLGELFGRDDSQCMSAAIDRLAVGGVASDAR